MTVNNWWVRIAADKLELVLTNEHMYTESFAINRDSVCIHSFVNMSYNVSARDFDAPVCN